MSDKKTSELLNCPFCDTPLKKIGSKRRGNQCFVHEYMKSDCILKEFGFKASEENFERWNTRIPMQNIVERLEKEGQTMSEKESMVKYGKAHPSSHRYYKAVSVKKAIKIVKEEGGIR